MTGEKECSYYAKNAFNNLNSWRGKKMIYMGGAER